MFYQKHARVTPNGVNPARLLDNTRSVPAHTDALKAAGLGITQTSSGQDTTDKFKLAPSPFIQKTLHVPLLSAAASNLFGSSTRIAYNARLTHRFGYK